MAGITGTNNTEGKAQTGQTQTPQATVGVTPQTLQFDNFSVDPSGTYQGTTRVNGVKYGFNGTLPQQGGPWVESNGEPTQTANAAVRNAIYQYLSTRQSKNTQPGLEVNVDLNTGRESIQGKPGIGTLAQPVETQTTPDLIPGRTPQRMRY